MLIFFMSITTTQVARIMQEINLPVAPNAAKKGDARDESILNIQWDPVARTVKFVFDERTAAKPDEFVDIMTRRHRLEPKHRLVIRGDRTVPVRHVSAAMAAAKAGISDITFAASPPLTMARPRKSRRSAADENSDVGFQIAPMIDVIFVVLAFFMSLTSAIKLEHELNTKLPGTAVTTDTVEFSDEQIIGVNADAAKTRVLVTIASNPEAPYYRTIDVLNVLAAARIDNVTFTVPDEV